jgi:hypothetical protein
MQPQVDAGLYAELTSHACSTSPSLRLQGELMESKGTRFPGHNLTSGSSPAHLLSVPWPGLATIVTALFLALFCCFLMLAECPGATFLVFFSFYQ